MQKFLRTLTFMALLLVPWVTQGQTVLFSEDFEGGTMPTGWTTDGPGTWSVTTGDYSSSTGAGQGTYNAKITHSSTGSSTKLITPAIDFTGVTSAVLNYMHIQRSWAGDVDELRVYYRTDTTGTWTLLDGQVFTSAVASWTTESDIVLPNLSSTYQIAFEYTDNYGYGIGIDNVIIEQGASCVKPSSLAATLTPGSGTIATLNWTAGGSETAWVLEYSTASDFTGATSVNVTGTPTANLTGLTAEATYYARVKAVCSANDQSGWCNTVCTFTPTNAYSITINDSTATNGYVPIYGYYVDNNTKSTFIIPATDLAAMQYGNITKLTFYSSNASVDWGNAQFTVYMTETTETTVSDIADFTTMDQVMTAASLGISNNIMEVTLTSPYQYMGGNLMIAFDQPTTGSYVSCTWYGVSATGASYGGYGTSVSQQNFLPKMRIDYTPGQAPTCAKPTQLAVNYTGGTSATLSWTSDATMWNIDVNGTVTFGLTANPTTITGLDFATTYNIMLQANCGNDTSEWTNPVSFTTDLCDTNNMCTLYITLTDAYGDGGGQFQVVDELTNLVLGTYSNSGTSADYTLNVCNGRTLNFVYTPTDSWAYENGWVVTDLNEDVVSSHVGCSDNCDAPASGIVGTYTVDCTPTSCRKPANLVATEIGNHTATLSWTERSDATSWMLAYAVAGDTNYTQIPVNDTTYTLTGLLAETGYSVKVRPVCSDQFIRWSDPISFTTDVACPAPTSLAVTPGPTVADVNWNGNANNYTLQYTQVPTGTFPTGDSIVLSYDNGSYASGIGNSSPQDWTWGVMYPASMYMGGNLTKVSVYEASNYYDTTYTVKIYSGGTTAPDSLLASQVVTPMGSDGFHEITLTSPVTIDFAQNLWIVVEAYGSYVMSSCNSTNPNNNWVYNGGVWVHLGDAAASLAGNGWMIRGQMNPFNLDALTWTTVNNATAPASLTGLTAETDYITRVKAVCGGQDGESAWETSLFTTLEVNPIPMDVVVTPAATRAAISWRGYSDSYKVYYRTAEAENVVFSEDFESDIDTTLWKIYTIGDAPQTNGWYTFNPESGLSFNAQSGSQAASAWSWNNTAYNADNWLVTPQVTLNGTLRYWERTNNGYPDRYEVIVSTTGNTIADFANGTTIRAYDYALNNSQWNEVDLDLSAFNGQLGYIAFHHADTDANYLLIDNLAIVSDTTPAGAWVEVATTNTNVTVTGLTPETTYEYRVTGIYNNVENNGTDIAQFTTDTQAFCPAPVLTVGEFQNRTASFSWTCPGDSVYVTLVNANHQQVWGEFYGPNTTSVTDMYLPENYFPFGYVYVYAVTICGDMADSNFSEWAYDGFAVTCDTTDQCTVSFVLNGQGGNGWQGGVLDVYDTISGAIVASMTLPADLNTYTTTYQLCTDRTYRVAFHDGTGAGQTSYSNVSFEIVGPNGETYFSASNPDTGSLGYFFHTCTAGPVNNIATLPYFADFENGNDGWLFYDTEQPNYWVVNSVDATTSNMAMFITNDGNSNAYTITSPAYSFATRQINIVDTGVYEYGFDWKANGESTYDFIRAALVPDSVELTAGSYSGFNNATGVPAGAIALDGGRLNLVSDWQTRVGTVNVTTPGTYKIVFLWRNDNSGGTQPPAAIDNVMFKLSTCPAVQNVTALPTHNSIALTWTAGGNETSWEVSCGDNTVTVNTNAYTFENLTASTDYTVSVRALCGQGDNSLPVIATVHTTCLPVQVPYSENFDNITTSTTAATGVYVDCWPFIMTGSSTYQAATYQPKVYYSATYANSGSYSLRLYGVSYTSLPPMAEPLSGLQLSFNAYVTSAAYKLAVGVMEGSDFVPVDTITLTNSTHNPVTVFFSNYTGNSRVIAFRNFNTSATSYLSTIYIDDVVVDYLPNCVEVTNLAVSDATSSSLTLTWADNLNNGATYTVSDSANVIASGITGTTYTVTGLASNTPYVFYVTANCSATDASDAVSVSGRTECAAFAAPYTWTFEDMTANAAPECWTKVGTGTTNVLSNATYAHESTKYLRFSGATSNLVVLPATVDEISGLQLRFWTRPENFTNANCGTFSVGYVTNASDASTFVEMANYAYNDFSAYEEKTVNFGTAPTGARMAMRHNAGSTSYYWYVDDVTIEELPSCVMVSNLSADSATANSITLTWSDPLNNGATYTIYNMDDSSVVATGITSTTYTVSNLPANTPYTFGVVANCSATDASQMVIVSARTACALLTAADLPYTEDFEAYNTGATATIDPCWTKGTNGTTAYPYPQSSATYLISGQRSLYFYGNKPSSSTGTQVYSYAALPELDASVDVSSLTVNFNAKRYSSTGATYRSLIYVGVMTDPTDISTFLGLAEINMTPLPASTIENYSVDLSNYAGNGKYVAFVCPAVDTTGYSYNYISIDDVLLDFTPTCQPVSGVTASNATSSTIDLSWTDTENNGATYTVYIDTTVVASGITGTTYTVTGLDANTNYTFGVVANCSADDASWMLTTTGRTACAVEQLPFTEDFSATLANDPCWRGASVLYTDGVTPTLGNISGWSYASAASNGLAAGHYRLNIYGTSKKDWLVTPTIDLTGATNPALTFDAAFTVYTSTSSDPANVSNIADDKFMVLVSTDEGQSWSVANNFDLTALASSTYLPQTVSLSQYAGQNVKLAFYGESTVSGGDNNLHIDNIAVTEVQAQDCQVPTITNVTYAPYNNGEGDYVATVTWNSTGAQSYEFCWNEPTLTRIINNGNDTVHAFVIHPNEASYVKVRAICGADNTSDWSDSVQLYVEQPITTDSVTVTFAVNDATMGSISPMGTVTYAVGDVVTMTATANEGYHLYAWRIQQDSLDIMLTEDIQTSYTDTVDESWDGYIYTAYFEADSAVVDSCIVTLPYAEDFEGADLGCWTIDGPGNWTIGTGDYSTSTGAYTGSTNAKITHGTTGNVTKLVSPAISGAENGVVLSFAHVQRSWTGDQDELRVYSRASATADWQMVAEYTNEVATWTLETLTIGGNVYQVAFEMTDGYGYGVGVDAVNIMAMSSDFCFAPTGLAVNYIGGNTNAAELTWTSDASLFNLSVNGTVTLGFATSSPATITGLDPNTTYTVMIQANCGNDTSAWTAPVTFTTPCDAIALPFVESFEETSATVNCWNFVSMNAANGLGTSNGMGFVTLTNGNRAWRFSSYSSASDYNQYGYSPIFNATADASALNVKVRYATYGSSDHLTFGYVTATDTVWDSEYHATSGQSDMQYYETVIPTTATQLAVHYYGSYSYYAWIDSVTVTEMTDAYCYAVTGLTATPAAFEVALTWNDANNDGASYSVLDATGTPVATGITGNNYTVTGLTPETSYTFAVVANCSATSASDAATVSTTTLPSCPAPTNLTVTLTPGDGTVATLAWTAGAQETAWQICLNGDTNNYIDVTTNPYTLTNLTAEQAYTAKVRAYCSADDQSAWSNTVNFTPTNAYSITVADGQATNSYVPVYGLYVDAYLNAQFVYPASTLSAIAGQNLTQMTFYATQSSVNWGNANFKVYLTEIADSSVSAFTDVNNMTLVYDGSLGITDNKMVVTFDDEYYYAGGNLMVAVIEDVTGTYVTSTWYGVETAGASVQGYSYTAVSSISPTQRNFMPKTTINYTEGVVPTCPKPTAVNVAYNGGTTATVSWTSDANAFNMEVNGTVTYGVNNPATITGLDLATTYTIRVQANCGNDTSEWTNPISFTTDNCMPEDQCQITIYAQDSYGDGWNGNTINVYQNGALVESYSMPTQSMMNTVIYDTAVITVCAGMPISFNWVSGGTYSYPDEVSFTIANALGQTVINAAGTDMTEGEFLSLDSCNSMPVLDSMKVTVAVNDATMGTTVPAPGVHYFYEGDTASVVAVPNNGYHLLGWTLYVTMDTTVALDTTINYAVDNVFDLFQGGWVVSHGDNIYEWTVTANFEADPTCMPVTDLTVDSITESSVTISWTDSTAASYDIYNGTTFVANVTTNTYTFTGLADGTAYTFGVMARCSATDSAAMVTVSATTLFNCADITTLPYNEGFENGVFGCWTTINGSSDGQPWNVQTAFSSGTITPHTGTYMAASWSWNSSAMHADAWLISPKFVLPSINAGDSLTFSWWEKTNTTYPDSYSVAVSTTTNDTASFTVVRPHTAAVGDWTMQSIDLTAYAGQSVYVAFHHVDYDENYLLIDDISLFQGAYVPPAPDTLTVTFATANATMGTTIPAPGTYQYFSGDTVTFEATANAGYHFAYWLLTYGNETDTVEYQSAYAPVDVFLNYYSNNVTLTAYFEAGNPDSTTITYAVNDATMGTIVPAPGTYTLYVGDAINAQAVPNNGYVLNAWVFDIVMSGIVYSSDTIYSDDSDFENPMHFGTLPQTFADNDASIVITALFAADTPQPIAMLNLIMDVNDTAMGTTIPEPGLHQIPVYDTLQNESLWAVANAGYRVDKWVCIKENLDGSLSYDTTAGSYNIGIASYYFATQFNSVTYKAIFTEDSSAVGFHTYTINVNDPVMGHVSVTSGASQHGDHVAIDAYAHDGYHFVSWSNGETNPTLSFYLTQDTVFTAYFAQDEQQTITVTFGVNDATMGTIDPNGTVTYAIGDSINVTATPFAGYAVESWTITAPDGQSQTINYAGTTYGLQALAEFDGLTVTVNFRQVTGIDDVETNDFTVYTVDRTIVVKGAENKPVYVYDVNGRCMRSEAKATETFEFTVSNTGVYLVKVANAPAKRVVVVR